MKDHAKAAITGSGQVGASRGLLGSAAVICGAFRVDGSGARLRQRLGSPFVLGICALAFTAATATAAEPEMTLGTVSSVSYGSAHVTGEVDPGKSDKIVYNFQFSTDTVHWVYGPFGYDRRLPAGDGPIAVGDDLGGLHPGTKYFVRLATYDLAGAAEYFSPEPFLEFETLPVEPPTVLSIDDASDVSYVTATVEGEVKRPANPDVAFDTSCRFEYVSDAQFTETDFQGAPQAPCEQGPLTEPDEELTVSAHLSGLKAGTTYHLRLSAEDSGGTDTRVAANTFTTASAATPALSIDPPNPVSFTKAHLSGTIDPEGGTVDYASGPLPIFWRMQISRDVAGEGWQDAYYGELPGTEPEGGGPIPSLSDTPIGIEADLEGLQNNAEYKFRLIASYANLEEISPEGTFTTELVTAPIVVAEDATVVTATSAHFSGHVTAGNNDPAFESSCAFDYVTDQQFEVDGFDSALTIGCDVNPVTGTIETTVGADVTGLEPNTTYHVRLRAGNQGGSSVSVAPETFTTDAPAPTAQTLGLSELRTTSAKLGARVNPRNSPITYQFKWGVDESYGNKVPVPAETLGIADNAFHVVRAPITGLQPETTYHYRILATNTQTDETSEGADKTFTTSSTQQPENCPNESSRVGPSAALPDCRAYEWASPGLNDASFSVNGGGIVAAADGNAFVFNSFDAVDDAESSDVFSNRNLAKKGPQGWTIKSLLSPLKVQARSYAGEHTVGCVSEDFSQSVVASTQPLVGPDSPGDGLSYYLHRADGSWVALSKGGGGQTLMVNCVASSDFTHIFFNSVGVTQLPSDPTSGGNAYEWVDGELHLVGILPAAGGEPEKPAPNGGTLAAGVLPAISADGSRVLFVEGTINSSNGTIGRAGPALYLRTDGKETVEVSATRRTVDPDLNPPATAISVGISADGSEILFTSASELTNDAYTGRTQGGVANDQGSDLYSYDVQSGNLTDLTVDNLPADAATGANVQRVVGASRDASFIYFVATGNLAPGAIEGEQNLYVEHEGAIDLVSPAAGMFGLTPGGGVVVYVTPGGRHMAFLSSESLTGYDNDGHAMVYKHTYGGALECASCRPSGDQPISSAAIRRRTLSDDGRRLFFESSDAVLPQASNGLPNVFEYESGEVNLLSPGDGKSPVNVLDASASGNDVFLSTFESLTSQQPGSIFGIYDARVNAEVAEPDAPICQGEGCRGAPTSEPDGPSSVTPIFRARQGIGVWGAKAVKGTKTQLRLIVPEGGELKVSGRGLRAVKKRASGQGSMTIALALKPAANRLRLRKGVFKTDAEVLFTPTAGETLRAEAPLKFEASTTKKGGR